MNIRDVILFGTVGAIVVVLLLLIVRLLVMVHRINGQFAKLGFIVREDAKKYFDDASEKIVDTNKQLQEMYADVVQVGTKRVLDESAKIMEKSISEAQARAGQVVVHAQADAQNILIAAKEQAAREHELALARATDTLQWTLEQYMRERFDISQHQDLIQRIVATYVNEHRK